MTHHLRMPTFSLLVFLLLLPVTLFAQGEKRLTYETMTDPGFRQAFSTTRTWWLDDNTALLYDPQVPDSIRTLERFDPKTQKRIPFLDREKAEASFKTFFSGERAPRFYPVPREFSGSGKFGLYDIQGDLYVLDIPNATFMRITDTKEEEESPHFSPDGMKLAYVRENDLYVYDMKAKKESRLTRDGSDTILNGTLSWVYWEEIFGRQDIGYWWSRDSRSIAYLRTDESDVSVQTYVNFSPWTPTVTTQRYPKVGEKNPVVRVGIIDLGAPSTIWTAIDPEAYEYVVRVDWIPGDKHVCVRTMNRLQTEVDMYLVDRKNGSATHVQQEKNEGWVNVTDDLYFMADGKHFIMASERDGYEHLYRFTLDGKVVDQITRGTWAVRSSGGGPFWMRQGVTGIDEKNGWIYFTALEKSSIEKHLYRIKTDGTGMKRLTTGDGTHSISMSPNAQYYFDRYSNVTTPPALSLHLADGKKLATLSAGNDETFKEYGVQYEEFLTIPARDGFPMPASIVKPKTLEPGKKYPVIVSVYGGPSAPTVSNSFSFESIFDNVLLNEGYIVLRVDNRAATAIGKMYENTVLNKIYGDVELNDLIDAVRWMKKQPYVDPDRFGITGWSGGGSYTILAMTRSKEFKAGIAGAGVTDFRFYDTKWGEAAMKTEVENKEGFDEVSLLNYAKDLHGRLLLVHGTHDDNVHIQNTWRFVDELINANKLFELMIYPLRKHGVGDRAGRTHLMNVNLDFWRRNL